MRVTKANPNSAIVFPRGIEVIDIGFVMWWALGLSIIVNLD